MATSDVGDSEKRQLVLRGWQLVSRGRMSGFGKSQDEDHPPRQTGNSGSSLLVSASSRPNIGKGGGGLRGELQAWF